MKITKKPIKKSLTEAPIYAETKPYVTLSLASSRGDALSLSNIVRKSTFDLELSILDCNSVEEILTVLNTMTFYNNWKFVRQIKDSFVFSGSDLNRNVRILRVTYFNVSKPTNTSRKFTSSKSNKILKSDVEAFKEFGISFFDPYEPCLEELLEKGKDPKALVSYANYVIDFYQYVADRELEPIEKILDIEFTPRSKLDNANIEDLELSGTTNDDYFFVDVTNRAHPIDSLILSEFFLSNEEYPRPDGELSEGSLEFLLDTNGYILVDSLDESRKLTTSESQWIELPFSNKDTLSKAFSVVRKAIKSGGTNQVILKDDHIWFDGFNHIENIKAFNALLADGLIKPSTSLKINLTNQLGGKVKTFDDTVQDYIDEHGGTLNESRKLNTDYRDHRVTKIELENIRNDRGLYHVKVFMNGVYSGPMSCQFELWDTAVSFVKNMARAHNLSVEQKGSTFIAEYPFL